MSTSDIHLKLDGIKGESTDARHRDEIVVDSWSWGVAASLPASGGGASVSKPTFSDLSFTHRVDRASPLLWRACATGRGIKEAVLSVTRAGSATQDYLTIRLRNVVVTAVALADAAGDSAPPLETVSMAFGSLRYGYRAQRTNGALEPALEFSHDRKTGKSS
jgi:type VI secretion system secreted protein Hcp